MPCYSAEGNYRLDRDEIESRVRSEVAKMSVNQQEFRELQLNFNLAKQHIAWYEGAMCALFSELDRRGIAASVIAESSRNGLIGLMDYWNQHKRTDESRLAAELHKYSKDEQAVLLKLLTQE